MLLALRRQIKHHAPALTLHSKCCTCTMILEDTAKLRDPVMMSLQHSCQSTYNVQRTYSIVIYSLHNQTHQSGLPLFSVSVQFESFQSLLSSLSFILI